jgi:TonB-dependent SusC/RagA subfamily outer membrane receptor
MVTANGMVQEFNWIDLLFGIYIMGLLIFTIKFIVQIRSLLKLVKINKVDKQGKFYHVETDKNIAPFSFFNHIFYNPTQYSESELSAIIKHEKAHSSQWHSIDVLLSHLITICTWMNPFSWLYQTKIKQNLEFLADERATKEVPSIKKYQYTLLKVSGNQFCTPIVNNFYNSLIKKRIVMLNKSKSNKRNILKIALILPALAVFLVSFNTKDVYIPIDSEFNAFSNYEQTSKVIEITIDKNTTNKELSKIKKDLAKKGVDFSYTVVHNPKNEITDISIDFSTNGDNGKKMRSSSNYNNGDDPIDPIHIIYDKETNSISMGNAGLMDVHEDEDIHFDIHETSAKTIWVHADSDGDEHKTIKIIKKGGKETIMVKGKEVSRKELDIIKEEDGIHEKHIKIKKSHGDKEENVFIMKMADDDIDIIAEEEGKREKLFIIKSDSDDKPMFIIDEIESTEKEMKYLNPSDIESINVLKGEMAQTKYGKKGKNGVVEITTKKQ